MQPARRGLCGRAGLSAPGGHRSQGGAHRVALTAARKSAHMGRTDQAPFGARAWLSRGRLEFPCAIGPPSSYTGRGCGGAAHKGSTLALVLGHRCRDCCHCHYVYTYRCVSRSISICSRTIDIDIDASSVSRSIIVLYLAAMPTYLYFEFEDSMPPLQLYLVQILIYIYLISCI